MDFNGNYSHGYGGGSGYNGEQAYQGQYPQYSQQMPPQQQQPQQQQQGYEHYTHPQGQAAQFDQHSQASGYGQQQEYPNNDGQSAYGNDAYAYQNARLDEKGNFENSHYGNGYDGVEGDEDNDRGLKEMFTKTTHDEYGTPRTQVNYLTSGIATVALVGGGLALRNYLKNKKAEKEQIPPSVADTGPYPPNNNSPYQSGTAVNHDGSQYAYNPYKDSSAHYH
ncbi:hypothetical protein H4R24_002971 [Coemansia sp. RSA 988]|nr:hypothetical protein H4R24_002971 [Coemansia sp. RSA 988]